MRVGLDDSIFWRNANFITTLSAEMCPVSGRNSLRSELPVKPFCFLIQKKTLTFSSTEERKSLPLPLSQLTGMHQTKGHREKQEEL